MRVRYRFREVQALVDPLRPSSLPRSSQRRMQRKLIKSPINSNALQSPTQLPLLGGSTSKQEVKHLPGGKIKKKDKQVVIEKVVRNRRKCITTVKGLDFLGPTKKAQIDVQGDISYDIVEFVTDSWPDVQKLQFFFVEDGKKVPAC
ncbi:unnamed protein product [Camellia sinensis]